VIFSWRVTNCLSVIDPTPVGLQNRTQCRGRRHNSRSPEMCSTRVLRNSYSFGSRRCSFGRRNEDRRCASSVQIDYRPHEPVRCWRLPVFLLLWDSKAPQKQRRPRARGSHNGRDCLHTKLPSRTERDFLCRRRVIPAGLSASLFLLRGRRSDRISPGIALIAFVALLPFLTLRPLHAGRPGVTLRTFEAARESERCGE
jgi:hypothetical protein